MKVSEIIFKGKSLFSKKFLYSNVLGRINKGWYWKTLILGKISFNIVSTFKLNIIGHVIVGKLILTLDILRLVRRLSLVWWVLFTVVRWTCCWPSMCSSSWKLNQIIPLELQNSSFKCKFWDFMAHCAPGTYWQRIQT